MRSNLAWRLNYSGKGLAWLERPQVEMHSQLPCFFSGLLLCY